MKIKLTSVYVDDQAKALRFYTEALGFVKKADFRQGPFRWLTVASPEEPDGTELQLALNNNPAAKAYQQAMLQQGQPGAMFFTDDVKRDYEKIKARGAEFTMPPTDVTGSTIAMKRRSILVHSVRRVPPSEASSSQRISWSPQLYSSTLGASARVTVVSVTCGVGAPTVVSFTVVPTVPRLPSASKGAHSRRCAGSVSACQTFSGEWRNSLTRMSVHFSPSFRTCAPPAGPGVYCSRLVIFFSLA